MHVIYHHLCHQIIHFFYIILFQARFSLCEVHMEVEWIFMSLAFLYLSRVDKESHLISKKMGLPLVFS
jgi:hypothetical protein